MICTTALCSRPRAADTKHLPHIKKERKRLRAKVEAKHRNFSLEDGGLEGPQKEHWHHMRALHDEIVGTAKVAVDTKPDKHVLSFRREINRKKVGASARRCPWARTAALDEDT